MSKECEQGIMMGRVAGEIVSFSADEVQTIFLGAYDGEVPIARSILESAGVVVENGTFFAADVIFGAETAEEVSPANFEALSDFEVRDLWAD